MGGILADDMGLGKRLCSSIAAHSIVESPLSVTGKTIQALAFLSALFASLESFRVLIVVPASVGLMSLSSSSETRSPFLTCGMAEITFFVLCFFQVMEQWAREAQCWGVTRLVTYAGPKRCALSTRLCPFLRLPFWFGMATNLA